MLSYDWVQQPQPRRGVSEFFRTHRGTRRNTRRNKKMSAQPGLPTPETRPKKVSRTVQGRSIPKGLLRLRRLRWLCQEEVDWLVLRLVFVVWGADRACELPRWTSPPTLQHSFTNFRSTEIFLHSVTKSEQGFTASDSVGNFISCLVFHVCHSDRSPMIRFANHRTQWRNLLLADAPSLVVLFQ